ncbi:dihydroxyacetone kinase family protein [Aeromicrobium sp.]
MTHIYNDATRFVEDAVRGFLAAYARYVEPIPGASGVMRRGGPHRGRVSVVVGGGSGHYPAFCGVVGPGMAHGAVIGDIFTSPSSEQAHRVGRALDGGAGILMSFGNYAGDVMNFGAAERRLRSEGIDCRTVLVTDDVASGERTNRQQRRGIAGDFTVFKVAGAAADRSDSIDEVERLARAANAATTSFGVAFGGCTFPGRSEPLFTVAPGTMDLGLGIHGEPGTATVDWVPAQELARLLTDPLLAERPSGASRAALLLNGLGATKYEELFVLFASVHRLLSGADVELVLPEVGELVTSLDMAGCSLTLTWLDDELEELWRAPADTPSFRRDAGAVHDAGSRDSSVASPTMPPAVDAPDPGGPPAGHLDAPPSDSSLRAAGTVRASLRAMLVRVLDNEEHLGQLDTVAGDGDHGVGMVRGLRGAVDAADVSAGGAGSVLGAAAAAFADRAGGSSGALWGALLGGIADGLIASDTLDAAAVAAAIEGGASALQQVGKCSLGDKTMFDALRPFADELTRRVSAGESLAVAWRAASEMASARAAATAHLVARLGRARPLGERSLGTPDPGAVSMAMCLDAVAEVLETP